MLDPLPVEMSENSLEKYYPNFGHGETLLPLEELYPLIERLNSALRENAAHPVYNPASHTINDFKWAHVRYGATTQLVAESNRTGKVYSSDANLVDEPEGKFQTYMIELDKLSKV